MRLIFIVTVFLIAEIATGQSVGNYKYFQNIGQHFNSLSYRGINLNYGMAKRFLIQNSSNAYVLSNNGIKGSSTGTSLTTYNMYSAAGGSSINLEYDNWDGIRTGVSGLRFNSKTKNRILIVGGHLNSQNSQNSIETQSVSNSGIGYGLDLSFSHKSKRWSHRSDVLLLRKNKALQVLNDISGLDNNQFLGAFGHVSEYKISLNNIIKAEAGGSAYQGNLNWFNQSVVANQSNLYLAVSLKQRRKKYKVWNSLKMQTFYSLMNSAKSQSTWLEYSNLLSLFANQRVKLSINNSMAILDLSKVSYLPQVALKGQFGKFQGKLNAGRFLNRYSNSAELIPYYIVQPQKSVNVYSNNVFGSLRYRRRYMVFQFSGNYSHFKNFMFLKDTLKELLSVRFSGMRNRNAIGVSGAFEFLPFASGSASPLIPKYKASSTFSFTNSKRRNRKSGNKKAKFEYRISVSAKYLSSQALVFDNKISDQRTNGNAFFDLNASYFPDKGRVKGKRRFIISMAAKNLTASKSLNSIQIFNSEIFLGTAWTLRPEYSLSVKYRIMQKQNAFGKYGF